jgi:quercetin dioxygenase-like cupin family protein
MKINRHKSLYLYSVEPLRTGREKQFRRTTMKINLLARIFIMLAVLAASTCAMNAQAGLVSCKPLSERTGEAGCWIILSSPLGLLPQEPVFWSLDLYPNHTAAVAAQGPRSTVVEALGKTWLFTIGPKFDPPPNGKRVTQIGPLPIKNGESYTAQYMEAILSPGSVARTHRHSGPEAFYTESGESCLETPEGKTIGKNGVDVIVPEGQPMSLTASGTETRRSIVLVLHSSDRPPTIVADDWKPKGLCKN